MPSSYKDFDVFSSDCDDPIPPHYQRKPQRPKTPTLGRRSNPPTSKIDRNKTRAGEIIWWANQSGQGVISEYGTSRQFLISLNEIKPCFGALVTGSKVCYEYDRGFKTFWVQKGCEYVPYEEAFNNPSKYPYMRKERRLQTSLEPTPRE